MLRVVPRPNTHFARNISGSHPVSIRRELCDSGGSSVATIDKGVSRIVEVPHDNESSGRVNNKRQSA
jgi:hypothetical protein